MTSAELAQAGRLEEALTTLQAEIRKKPDDERLRVFLFQLNCVLGRFDKALTQLQVIASLNAETMLLAQIFRPVIACEMLRREVFEGKRTPMIFGEPMEWLGLLVQANALVAKGEFSAAAEARSKAFDAAPASPGKLDGEAFEWIADADSRLGPVLEAIIEGKYYWVPFCRIQKLELPKPSDMRDLVWIPGQFTWTNGGSVPGHIPSRYPGTENSSQDQLKLVRQTEWREEKDDTFLGLGQRVLATDIKDFPLLECRTIEFNQPGI
ncbi:MAG TPA: type VI secretion system accessory protein TagJ [Candidatus Dormibacteraeota bacterium]|nr:type VI secretion system accessory protein TagJ [Candidatus Dormibacteraeota bacterium]